MSVFCSFTGSTMARLAPAEEEQVSAWYDQTPTSTQLRSIWTRYHLNLTQWLVTIYSPPSPGCSLPLTHGHPCNMEINDHIIVAQSMEIVSETVGYGEAPTSSSGNSSRQYFSDLVELAGVRYTLVALHVLTTILAGFGNGTLIYFILKNRKLRTNVTAYLVLNLAVCDFITTCIHQPMRLADILMPFTYKDSARITQTYCQIKEFIAAFFAGVAFHTIVAISQERHLLVCYPLEARGWLTVSRIKKLLCLIWVVSFVALLPAYVWYTFIAHVPLENANVTFCMIDIVNNDTTNGLSYFLFLFCLYFVLPTLVISITYGRIFYVLSRNIHGTDRIKDQRFAKVLAARKRLAKLMLFIAVVFIIFHAPFFVTYLLVSQGYDLPENPIFSLLVIEFMGSLNSVFNPFIYSAHSKTLFQGKMVSFLGGQDTEGSLQRQDTVFRSDGGTADTASSTPSRQGSTPTRKVSTPTRLYQTIVHLNPDAKDSVHVWFYEYVQSRIMEYRDIKLVSYGI